MNRDKTKKMIAVITVLAMVCIMAFLLGMEPTKQQESETEQPLTLYDDNSNVESDEPDTEDYLTELGGLMGRYDYINNCYYDGTNNDYYQEFKKLCDMSASYEGGYAEGYQDDGEYASYDNSEMILNKVNEIADYLEVAWWNAVSDTTENDREDDLNLLVGEWRRTDDGSDEVMRLWHGDDGYNDGEVTRSDGHVIGTGEPEWHTDFETETGKLMLYMYFFDDGEEGCVIDDDFYYEYDRDTDSLVGIGKNKACYERI